MKIIACFSKVFFLGRMFFLGAFSLLVVTPVIGSDLPSMSRVPHDALPRFSDDFSVVSLQQAIANSLNYLSRVPPERTYRFSDENYSASWLVETLQTFQQLVQHTENPSELNRLIQNQFEVYQASGSRGSSEMLVTGYYEPLLEGSLKKKAPHLYPLYSVPPDLVSNSQADGAYKNKTGRLHNGKLVPYWSRSEIEKFDFLAGHELVYLADPVEAFILHVQGSGRVKLTDGSIRRLQYAAKNGRPYRSIGKLLIDEGKMEKNKVDLPGIVKYLRDHPEERERILHYNESFVFFRWGEDREGGPLGSLGEPLTAGRSIALDHSRFPSGALCFLQTQKLVVDSSGNASRWAPMARFVLNQDSGSAIKGPGRLDLFWGSDRYAQTAAGRMKHPGKLYFLIKKR